MFSPIVQEGDRLEESYVAADFDPSSVPLPEPEFPALDTHAGAQDPLIDEISAVLRDWCHNLKECLKKQSYTQYAHIKKHVTFLFRARRQLLVGSLGTEASTKLRKDISNRIHIGNQLQSLDHILRDTTSGAIIDDHGHTMISIHNMHTSNNTSPEETVSASSTNLNAGGIASEILARQHQIFFELRSAGISISQNDSAELRFSLYSQTERRFVTEDFVILVKSDGTPKDPKPSNNRTLFLDLTSRDLSHDLFFVCKVVKVGGLTDKDSTSNSYRRPVGVAVLECRDILQGKETQPTNGFQMRVFPPFNEPNFGTMHEVMIEKTGGYDTTSKGDTIYVSLRALQGDLDKVTKDNPSLIKDVHCTPRMGFSEVLNPHEDRHHFYITLVSGEFHKTSGKNIEVVCEARSESGETLARAISKGIGLPPCTEYESYIFYHNSTPKWHETFRVEMPAEVFEKGHIFFQFRHCSSGAEDKAEKTFSWGILPLIRQNGAVVSDGPQQITLYKYEKKHLTGNIYLFLSGVASANTTPLNGMMDPTAKLVPAKDTFLISTQLTSTKFTQNLSLMKVLNWKRSLQSTYNDMPSILKDIRLIAESELLKFVKPILDALFGILNSPKNQTKELSDLIFADLLHIFNLVLDRRYHSFKPVLVDYIANKFSAANSGPHLIKSMKHLLSDFSNPILIKDLRTAIKVFEFTMKIIIKARDLQRQEEKNVGQIDDAKELKFKDDLKELFQTINHMMADVTQDALIAVQTMAFQHFANIVPVLSKCFSSVEIADIIISFTDSLASKKGTVIHYKLQFIQSLIKGSVFDASESRCKLTQATVRWIKDHIAFWEPSVDQSLRQEIFKLCISILAELLNKIQTLIGNGTEIGSQEGLASDMDTLMSVTELLPNLMEAYKDAVMSSESSGTRVSMFQSMSQTHITINSPSSASGVPLPPALTGASPIQQSVPSFAPTQSTINASVSNLPTAKLASTMLAIFHLLSESNIGRFFYNVYNKRGRDGTSGFLKQIFSALASVLQGDAYPQGWVNLNIIIHKTALKVFKGVALVMKNEYVPEPGQAFDQDLWTQFFYMVLTLLSSPHLQVEFYTAQKWRAVSKLEIDILADGSQLLKTLWSVIGRTPDGQVVHDYQLRLIPFLIGRVIELTISSNPQIRESALDILFSMIKREYAFCKSIKRLERDVLEHIDRLVLTECKGDDVFRRNFGFITSRLLRTRNVVPELRRQCREFFLSVDQFLILLLRVRNLPPGEEFEEERRAAIFRLANFMKSIGRTDIYIKYVHHLAMMQLKSSNYTEAGATLKLHADLLQWSTDNILDANEEVGFEKSQTEFERKEELYYRILEYFDEGKCWESAIMLCKELAAQYETMIYDYQKLSEILKRQATLCNSIRTQERYYSEYFRVGYYGKGFPTTVRNKQFIYRGLEWEKIGPFCERIQNKHPDSTLLKSNVPPKDDILNSNGRYLQITKVAAEPDKNQAIFAKGDLVAEPIRQYYEFNNINTFSFTRPFRKGQKSDNEFLDLWTEKTYYTTEEMFPHCLTRSEVISVRTVEFSPIENAVQAMTQKNQELLQLEKKYGVYKQPGEVNCNPLSMSLNGAVDAPVNGGVPMYKKAFIKSDFRKQSEEQGILVQKLEDSIDEQVIIIHRCIEIHNRIAPAQMRPLHETIVNFFYKNFAEEIERLGLQRPVENTTPTITSVSSGRAPSTLSLNTPTISTGSSKNNNYRMSVANISPSSSMNMISPVTSNSGMNSSLNSPSGGYNSNGTLGGTAGNHVLQNLRINGNGSVKGNSSLRKKSALSHQMHAGSPLVEKQGSQTSFDELKDGEYWKKMTTGRREGKGK
ncbi:dedicator of cytokinesis-domain-containing protein [Paraphysoderma sedebokerense]|nr:dedicator of cytokinesis-domain-containing protein [Paraphysoderma sedebokerense]